VPFDVWENGTPGGGLIGTHNMQWRLPEPGKMSQAPGRVGRRDEAPPGGRRVRPADDGRREGLPRKAEVREGSRGTVRGLPHVRACTKALIRRQRAPDPVYPKMLGKAGPPSPSGRGPADSDLRASPVGSEQEHPGAFPRAMATGAPTAGATRTLGGSGLGWASGFVARPRPSHRTGLVSRGRRRPRRPAAPAGPPADSRSQSGGRRRSRLPAPPTVPPATRRPGRVATIPPHDPRPSGRWLPWSRHRGGPSSAVSAGGGGGGQRRRPGRPPP
jgi:hypothetical protein